VVALQKVVTFAKNHYVFSPPLYRNPKIVEFVSSGVRGPLIEPQSGVKKGGKKSPGASCGKTRVAGYATATASAGGAGCKVRVLEKDQGQG